MTDNVNTDVFSKLQRLKELRVAHRDLDVAIAALARDLDADQLRQLRDAAASGRAVRPEYVVEVLDELGAPQIDLMKVNIEGGEYDLLPALIDAGIMPRIGILQVQFHLFSADDIPRRDAIRAHLAQTHDCDWSYDFVWEQWSRRT